MKAKVTYNDGREVEAVIGPRAQVAVERRFDMLYTEVFDPNSTKARLDCMYYAAWAAAHYAGLEPEDDYDTWLTLIQDVEPIAEGSTRPTKRARKPANSSSSAS